MSSPLIRPYPSSFVRYVLFRPPPLKSLNYTRELVSSFDECSLTAQNIRPPCLSNRTRSCASRPRLERFFFSYRTSRIHLKQYVSFCLVVYTTSCSLHVIFNQSSISWLVQHSLSTPSERSVDFVRAFSDENTMAPFANHPQHDQYHPLL